MRNYRLHRFDRYTTRNLQDASVQLLQILREEIGTICKICS